ncbi:MAG: GNAT family N-acyltransferase [Pseudomonadota bacterium]
MLQSTKQFLTSNAEPSSGGLLGKLGDLETRLAQDRQELRAAQKVRYQVFCEELSARKNLLSRLQKRELDAHDEKCDHLLVLDRRNDGINNIVGTQRFFVRRADETGKDFYSQQEFDVEALVGLHPEKTFMELGRSCILPNYRGKRTMELMWQGTWAYALQNKVDVMLGCASFHTCDAEEVSDMLGFLSGYTGDDEVWQVGAVADDKIVLKEHGHENPNDRRIFKKLPPLIKGYLRLGAIFSTEAVRDHEFGTIDVLVVLPIEHISKRYLAYYGEDASKHRA